MAVDLEKVNPADTPSDCIERSHYFQRAIEGASVQVARSSRVICTQFDYFRDLSLALLVRTILCKQGQEGTPQKQIGETISLIATYVQGANRTRDLIVGGYHSKAAAVLKQDYEMLARLGEIEAGAAKAGVTPNARYAPEGSQRLYGGLNSLAHPSQASLVLQHLRREEQNGVIGINPFPTFVKRTIEVHFWTHVWLTFEFCRNGVKLLADIYGWEDKQVRDCVKRFAVVEDEGIRCGVLNALKS